MDDNARRVLDAAVRAHGGAALWAGLTGLRLKLRIRGVLLLTRGRNPFWHSYTAEVSTREPRTVLSPYGAEGGRGVYAGDTVRIERKDGGLIAERSGARAHARSQLLWDDLDLLYLLGYALWAYHNQPFLLCREGVDAVEIEPWRDRRTGELLRRLRVMFPPEFHVHCRDQLFHFDERGFLVRFDYGAEVFNPKRRGAHLCEDYRSFGGLMIPTHRYAVPVARGTRPLPLIPAVIEAFIDDVELITGS